jgi:Ran GTPase-activating protein (RanGAP) involved in mRNA processing and transport
LELHKIEFQSADDRRTGVTFLASALASTRSLQVLKLSDLSLIDEDKNVLLERLSLSASATLRVLHLEGMSLGESHAQHIARILSNQISNLQELWLSKNDLNSLAIETVVTRGLVRNSKLLRLVLSHNPVGDAGAASLAAGLKSNVTLQELRIVDCEIWQSGCSELISAIPYYAALTRLSLDGNDFEECLDRLNTVIEMNVSLVHVLDSMPRLLHTERRQLRLQGASSASCGPYGFLDYYLRLNHAHRRFFVEPNLSISLLPRVLERKEANSDPSIIYYFLRHSPSIYANAMAGNTVAL